MRGTAGFTAKRPLIGRDREVAAMEAAVRDVTNGNGMVVTFSGEPGIGKTRLAGELAAYAARFGVCPIWGKCPEAGGAPAYWPWAQMLRCYADLAGDAEWRAMLGAAAVHIAVIAPDLAERCGTPVMARSEDFATDGARFAVFEGVTAFLARAARRRPLALIFDDVHVADPSSLLLMQFVANAVRGMPIVLVGTYRDAELRRRDDVATILGEIVRNGMNLTLRGFTQAEILEFLHGSFDVAVPASTATRLMEMTGGNPFLLEEVARALLADRRLDRLERGGDCAPLPVHARELLGGRIALLQAPARTILRVAALIGQEFSLPLLSAVCDRAEPDVLHALREAMADDLIVATPGGVRYRFRHALIREALAAELTATEQIALHRTIGLALEVMNQGPLEPYLDALSYHFRRAAPGGDWQRAVRYAAAAGARALTALAYEAAAEEFTGALEALELAPGRDEAQRAELLLALGTCRLKSADLAGARGVFADAAAIARALGRPDLLGRAALGFAPWTAYGRTSDSGAGLLEEAIAAQPEGHTPLRALLTARLAHVLEGMGTRVPRARVLQLAREAIDMARQTGDPHARARALIVGRWVDWDPATFAARAATTDELDRLARQLNERELEVLVYGWQVCDAIESGAALQVDAALNRHAVVAEILRQPEHLWWNAVWRATRTIMEGRWREGEELVQQALQLGVGVEGENAQLVAYLQQAQMLLDHGQIEQNLAILDALVRDRREVLEGDPVVACRRGQFLIEIGRTAEARVELERLASDDFAALPLDMRYGPNLAALALVVAGLGDVPRARLLYERLRPADGRNIVFGPALIVIGPVARSLGLLATTMGEHARAAVHFEAALDMSRRMGWVPLLARIQCEYAAMLMRAGMAEGRERARELLEESENAADRLGMMLVARRAQALLERTTHTGENDRAPSWRGARDPAPTVEKARVALAQNVLRRDGDYWTITYRGTSCRLRDMHGMRYLAELLRVPGREVHALDLAATLRVSPVAVRLDRDDGLATLSGNDRDGFLDPVARRSYRDRIREIDAELAAAERDNDVGSCQRLHSEREAVEAELMRAIGFNGRARRAASDSERARLNVTRAIKSAVARIDRNHPALAHHLLRCLRTGTFCVYLPDPRVSPPWTVLS